MLSFQAFNNLAIYFNGNNSVIEDQGSGNTILSTNGNGVFITKNNGSAPIADFRTDESVILYHDGDEKFIRKTSAASGKYEYVDVNTEEEVTEGEKSIPHNELFRIRTRTGHQILLHNSEDLVYIANANGSAWIEMTASGKVDIFANDSVSIHSKGDFYFKTDRDFNLEANRNINLKASTINTEVATENLKVTGTQTNQIGATQNTTVGATSNLYAGANVNIDVGGLVNIANGVFSGAPVTDLSVFTNPGETTDSIMKRIPQHEPWTQHENYDPIAVAVAKTDRNVVSRLWWQTQ